MKITRVEAVHCLLGEGPVWDVAQQALYLLDIGARRVYRFDPRAGTTRSWTTPIAAGAMALRQSGGAVLAMKDTIYTLDFANGALEPMTRADSQPPEALFNDGKVDRRGRFVIGSCCSDLHNPQLIGGLYSLGADRAMTLIDRDVCFSNGPCWSPDGKTLYFSDSWRHACFAYDYDIEAGRVSNRRLFADTRALGGMPDGATVDSDGRVWMAIFRGAKVVAFRPDGKIERVVDMPVSLTVSAMFGGPNLDQLYVTTIDPEYFGSPPEEGAGYLYVIEGLGVRGLPEPRYVG